VASSPPPQAGARARLLRSRGLPAVLSLRQLATATDVPYDYLRSIVSRTRDPYFDLALPTRSGIARPISSPEPLLADVQRWLLREVLSAAPVHRASHAYARGRSIRTAAEQHVGARWLVKLDVHSFFHAIHEPSVYRVYSALGYPPLVALEMTRISTRLQGERRLDLSRIARYPKIEAYAAGGLGVLPQGAPTSGLLANAVAFRLDEALSALADSRGLGYTRYSDDLTFSGFEPFDRGSATELVREVSGHLRRAGFVPHLRKTRIVPPGARKVVLGLLVDEHGVRLLPEYKRRIETHLRGCEKWGLVGHSQHRGFDSILGLMRHLEGLIAFAIGIEALYGREQLGRWRRVLEPYGMRPGVFARAGDAQADDATDGRSLVLP